MTVVENDLDFVAFRAPSSVSPPRITGRPFAMDKFVERQNIAHYVELLKTETDPIKCTMLQKLLAEARSGKPHTIMEN